MSPLDYYMAAFLVFTAACNVCIPDAVTAYKEGRTGALLFNVAAFIGITMLAIRLVMAA